jgi:MEKHLA domain
MDDRIPIWERDEIISHTECLSRSLTHWTGRELLPGVLEAKEKSRRCFEGPFVVVSHGTQADPILNYGNQAALTLWDISWEELTQMPSRLTAEAPNREERARLLEQVTQNGFIDNYAGIRIAKSGRRFLISKATVWNLLSLEGAACGQAAMFRHWVYLD